jgi:hypothetical protein
MVSLVDDAKLWQIAIIFICLLLNRTIAGLRQTTDVANINHQYTKIKAADKLAASRL